jgi:hypothetical protein
MRRVLLPTFVSAVLLILAGYHLASPFLFLGSLKSALYKGDSTALENLVDFPSVRQSLKAQLSAVFTHFMATDPDMKNNPFFGLGALFGPAMIDRMVDSYCTPEMLSMSLKNAGSTAPDPDNKSSRISIPRLSQIDWAKYHLQPLSFDCFQYGTDDARLLVRWEGLGWKVTKLEFSPKVFESNFTSTAAGEKTTP